MKFEMVRKEKNKGIMLQSMPLTGGKPFKHKLLYILKLVWECHMPQHFPDMKLDP